MDCKLKINKKYFVNKDTGEQIRYYEFVAELDGQRILFRPSEKKRDVCNYILDKIYK